MYFQNFSIDMIKNNESINIFSDASMRPHNKGHYDSCYGAVAVYKDNIICEDFRISSDVTVPAAEAKGIRLSLQLAYALSKDFRCINLFSDSQLSVFSLREYMHLWRYDPELNLLTNKMGNPVKNQSIYIECNNMIEALRNTGHIVNIYHQKGHVDSGNKSILNALEVFKRSNNIQGKVDYNSIRYISVYNNYVDNKSRSIINRTNIFENTYRDPVSFYPTQSIYY